MYTCIVTYRKEMLLGNSIAVVVLLLMPKIGPWLQRTFQLQRSIFLRLVLSTHCLALVNLLMALAEDEISMLLMGAVQSFLNAMVLNTSHSLAAAMNGNRRAWVQLGFLSGALLPVMTTPFTGFGPKSHLASRIAFYAVPASYCFIIGLLFGVYHRKVKPHLDSESDTLHLGPGPLDRGNMAELAEAYRRFERPDFSVERPGNSNVSTVSTPGWHFYVAFLAVLCHLTGRKDFLLSVQIRQFFGPSSELDLSLQQDFLCYFLLEINLCKPLWIDVICN